MGTTNHLLSLLFQISTQTWGDHEFPLSQRQPSPQDYLFHSVSAHRTWPHLSDTFWISSYSTWVCQFYHWKPSPLTRVPLWGQSSYSSSNSVSLCHTLKHLCWWRKPRQAWGSQLQRKEKLVSYVSRLPKRRGAMWNTLLRYFLYGPKNLVINIPYKIKVIMLDEIIVNPFYIQCGKHCYQKKLESEDWIKHGVHNPHYIRNLKQRFLQIFHYLSVHSGVDNYTNSKFGVFHEAPAKQ